MNIFLAITWKGRHKKQSLELVGGWTNPFEKYE